MENILSKKELEIIKWMAESTYEDIIEASLNGISGGIHRIKYKPNDGKFNSKFIKDVLMSNQGDNDYDYELGRYGWQTIIDNIVQISKEYLSLIESSKSVESFIKQNDDGQEIIDNIKKSLEKIISE